MLLEDLGLALTNLRQIDLNEMDLVIEGVPKAQGSGVVTSTKEHRIAAQRLVYSRTASENPANRC